MIKIPKWNEECFIYLVAIKSEKEKLDDDLIHQAYSYLPGPINITFPVTKKKQAIIKYVIMNGEIFRGMDIDYSYGWDFEDLIEYEYEQPVFYNNLQSEEDLCDITGLSVYYKELGYSENEIREIIDDYLYRKHNNLLFTENIPMTDDDKKSMKEWNKMMKKQYK